jgi:hypothetical protein
LNEFREALNNETCMKNKAKAEAKSEEAKPYAEEAKAEEDAPAAAAAEIAATTATAASVAAANVPRGSAEDSLAMRQMALKEAKVTGFGCTSKRKPPQHPPPRMEAHGSGSEPTQQLQQLQRHRAPTHHGSGIGGIDMAALTKAFGKNSSVQMTQLSVVNSGNEPQSEGEWLEKIREGIDNITDTSLLVSVFKKCKSRMQEILGESSSSATASQVMPEDRPQAAERESGRSRSRHRSRRSRRLEE